ncbi:MAG: hypothetical protein ACT452_08625 [Microthrixaceae bacterium]
MKLIRRAALGLAVLLGLIVAVPNAQAAGPYTIAAPGTTPFSATVLAWDASRCNPTILTSPLNGVEARIVNVSAFAGRTIRLTWTHIGSAAAPGLGLHFQAKAYTASCSGSGIGSLDWSPTKNTMTMPVPAGTKWMSFTSLASAQISFTIT